jgi:hypothetical protein
LTKNQEHDSKTSNKTRPRTQTQQRATENKNCKGTKGSRAAEIDGIFFGFFWTLGNEKQTNLKGKTKLPNGQPENLIPVDE